VTGIMRAGRSRRAGSFSSTSSRSIIGVRPGGSFSSVCLSSVCSSSLVRSITGISGGGGILFVCLSGLGLITGCTGIGGELEIVEGPDANDKKPVLIRILQSEHGYEE